MPTGFQELTGRPRLRRPARDRDRPGRGDRALLRRAGRRGRAGDRHRRRAQRAFAYYEQGDQRYRELESDTHHEIVGFTGNVSLRDDRPFLHAHATFADATGATVGGHLLRGCEVFVAEVMIREITRRRARSPSGCGHGAGAVVRR